MRVVIDTNVLLAAVPRMSPYNWIFVPFLPGKYELAFSNDILTEYEEQFFIHWHPLMAEDVSLIILEAYNSVFVDVYFQFHLIKDDSDDNKFADCAVSSNADFLITFDKHFNILKTVSFPKITVVHPDEFKTILLKRNLL